jgi:hypothetical protein
MHMGSALDGGIPVRGGPLFASHVWTVQLSKEVFFMGQSVWDVGVWRGQTLIL